MLDIEVAGAVASGATIAVYFAPNTDAGFLDAINQAVMDTVNKPSVISISWGGPESSWTAQSLQSYNSALQSAAAVGVTVCVAAGDNGSTDGVTDGQQHVDFPASSPYALACGGTTLRSAAARFQAKWYGTIFQRRRRHRRRGRAQPSRCRRGRRMQMFRRPTIRATSKAVEFLTWRATPTPRPATRCRRTVRASPWAAPAPLHHYGRD